MIKLSKIIAVCFVIGSLTCSDLFAQRMGGGEANPNLHTNEESLDKWQNMRFGMFIHWGPVSLRGTEIGWSRGRELSKDDYDKLYKEFDPVLFDAAAWVETARQAGMKYLIITAKHHDGFSLWDTKYSEYDMMNTPFGMDILKMLAEECEKQGIEFGLYYSIADWYHKDYPAVYPSENSRDRGYKTETERASMSRYVSFMKSQLKELIENYDPAILWFDGEWEWPWTHQMGMDLYAYVRQLKPEILINNRVDKGREGMAGMTISDKYAGDFGTPEQEIGSYNTQTPWESCITIGEQWAWRPNDELKSAKDLVRLLLNTVGGDGNFLLNVGPMMDGRIEHRQTQRLREVGNWLEKYEDSVFGTRGGPYIPTESMVSTRKGNRIFIHLLDPSTTSITLPIPEELKIENAQFLGTEASLDVTQTNSHLQITLPTELPDNLVSVIELKLNKSVQTLEKIDRYRY